MQDPKNAQVKDLLKLETTLYTLTLRCMKTCKHFLTEQFDIKDKAEVYDLLLNNNQINHHFNVCLQKCTQDYVSLHKLVRMQFMKDLDDVYKHNQEAFDDFYK
jgi:hypothetical protein